jgi:hypothetical protein
VAGEFAAVPAGAVMVPSLVKGITCRIPTVRKVCALLRQRRLGAAALTQRAADA